jgi:trigger factor
VASVTAALQTTVTELPDSRVRVQVEVQAAEVERRLERKARQLGRELKLPGFRRGKVPAALVLQRLGRDAVLDQAVRESLGGWYADAIQASGIAPVGDPKLDLAELPSDGAPLEFSIEIGVLPQAQLGDYSGLDVPRREAHVEEERIDGEIDALRERLAKLETVERTAATGDFVVIDYVGSLPQEARGGEGEGEGGDGDGADGEGADEGAAREPRMVPFAGGEGRDQLIELGGGNLIPGFEEALVGASAGERRDVRLTFPADYHNDELAGREATFAVTVKEIKQKLLPDVDEDLAVDVGFDTVQELREDVRARLLEAEEASVRAEFREAALNAAVERAQVPLTDELVKARAGEMWERLLHSLAHRGISRESYLQIAGREEADVLADMQGDAEQALRREAVLSAIVAAEAISPSEEQLLEALAPTAEREGVEPVKLIEDLRESGRLQEASEELAARMAVDLVAERAKPISVAQAQAREALWTPGREAEPAAAATSGAEAPGKLWTPTGGAAAS